ncbi:MAG: LuxR C-terminal-related transcriptional regulator [Nitrosomonas sp.]|nr:MAG: LuxR C-terminal-related transcriptional regulator [Nitrosomonas sp.]
MPKKSSDDALKSGASACIKFSDEQVGCAVSGNQNIVMDIASFELSGHQCKLVALKEEQSKLVITASATSARQYCFVDDEIAHFCLDGKWFALCKERCEGSPIAEDKLLHNLTERELQIVQLVCHGLLTKQIAVQLSISEFTVNTYIKAIFNKLNVRSRAAMVYKFTELTK